MKRNFVFIAVITALVLGGISCTKEKLNLYNWSYYTPESVIKKFEQEYNVRVVIDEFASNEEMFTKLSAGGAGYDIVFPSHDFTAIMIRQGMLAGIDKSLLPNLKNIDPAIFKKMTYDPNMEYSVPYFWGAPGIVVNKAKVPDYEESWNIFSRSDLKGRMTMLDDMREVIGEALNHLGYSVNSTNPHEIEAARDFINNQWKPNLVKFDSDTFGKGYANGEFWVVHAYAEVVFEEIMDDEQLLEDTVFFIPPGSTGYIDNMCILKSAKNVELAHKFINFIHRPEIYAEFCNDFGFPATVNVPARQFIEGPTVYDVEDIIDMELKYDVGEALEYYADAWFKYIIVGD